VSPELQTPTPGLLAPDRTSKTEIDDEGKIQPARVGVLLNFREGRIQAADVEAGVDNGYSLLRCWTLLFPFLCTHYRSWKVLVR